MATVATGEGNAVSGRAPSARVARADLFAGLFLLATLNGIIGWAVDSVRADGLLPAFTNLFGISAVVWLALAAGIAILRQGEAEPVRRLDVAVAAMVVAVALLPSTGASRGAIALLAVYAIATSPSQSPIRRAGIIFLAITGAILWGRIALDTFGASLLALDATFVATLLGVPHGGNMIWTPDGAWRLVVFPGCSSMQGISVALLFWATVNQYFRVPFGWSAAGWAMLALAATVAINVVRIAALLWFPDHFEAIHTGWGWHLFMWATLLAVGAITLFGARREIFGR